MFEGNEKHEDMELWMNVSDYCNKSGVITKLTK